MASATSTPRRGLRASINKQLNNGFTQPPSMLEELKQIHAVKRSYQLQDEGTTTNVASQSCGQISTKEQAATDFTQQYKCSISLDGSDQLDVNDHRSNHYVGQLHRQVKEVLEQEGYVVDRSIINSPSRSQLKSDEMEMVCDASRKYQDLFEVDKYKDSFTNAVESGSPRCQNIRATLGKALIVKNEVKGQSEVFHKLQYSRQQTCDVEIPSSDEEKAHCSDDGEDDDGQRSLESSKNNIRHRGMRMNLFRVNSCNTKDTSSSSSSSSPSHSVDSDDSPLSKRYLMPSGYRSSDGASPLKRTSSLATIHEKSHSSPGKAHNSFDSIEEMESSMESNSKSRRRPSFLAPLPPFVDHPSKFFKYINMRESKQKQRKSSLSESATDSICSPDCDKNQRSQLLEQLWNTNSSMVFDDQNDLYEDQDGVEKKQQEQSHEQVAAVTVQLGAIGFETTQQVRNNYLGDMEKMNDSREQLKMICSAPMTTSMVPVTTFETSPTTASTGRLNFATSTLDIAKELTSVVQSKERAVNSPKTRGYSMNYSYSTSALNSNDMLLSAKMTRSEQPKSTAVSPSTNRQSDTSAAPLALELSPYIRSLLMSMKQNTEQPLSSQITSVQATSKASSTWNEVKVITDSQMSSSLQSRSADASSSTSVLGEIPAYEPFSSYIKKQPNSLSSSKEKVEGQLNLKTPTIELNLTRQTSIFEETNTKEFIYTPQFYTPQQNKSQFDSFRYGSNTTENTRTAFEFPRSAQILYQ